MARSPKKRDFRVGQVRRYLEPGPIVPADDGNAVFISGGIISRGSLLRPGMR